MMKPAKKHWSDAARDAATRAAAKAGVSLEGLRIEVATLDRTWGDKVGLAVSVVRNKRVSARRRTS